MKHIYIGFSYKKGFAPISVIIQKVLKTNFSHTYFKFKNDDLDESTIFHAVNKGLVYISESNFKKDNEIVKEFHLEVTPNIHRYILNLCHVNASKKYGFWQNLGVLFVKGLHKIGIKYRRNPFNDGINCSEWLANILHSTHPGWTNKSADLITPDDIYNFLSKIK